VDNQTTNFEKFIITYNEIDDFMRRELNLDETISHSDMINKLVKRSRVFAAYKHELLLFAKLRNAIVHNPEKKDADPIAEPHDNIVIRYESIKQKVLDPPKALDSIAVKADCIYTTSLEAKAINVMKIMNNNTYTHVPVVEDGMFFGVFSENTIFSYMTKKEEIILERDVKIREFIEQIPIDKHESEFFEFVPRDTLVVDIEEMFQKELMDRKRLAVVFITQNGKPNEKLIGMVTAWDIAGYNRNI
jgi:predicted transcriptional regulator